jgi:hypothetical protein
VIKSSHITEMSDRAVAQRVGRRTLTEEAGVPSHGTPCGIYDRQSDSGTGFSFPQSVLFHQLSTRIHSSITDPT